MSSDERVCKHCGIEVREINWALGKELMHSEYPYRTREAYRSCKLTVAEVTR